MLNEWSDSKWPYTILSDLAQPALVVSGAAPVPWFTGGQHISLALISDSPTIDGLVQVAACMFREITSHILSGPVLFYHKISALPPMFA